MPNDPTPDVAALVAECKKREAKNRRREEAERDCAVRLWSRNPETDLVVQEAKVRADFYRDCAAALTAQAEQIRNLTLARDNLVASGQAIVAGVERLREALQWAVGFIRCQHPDAYEKYPDMRNAATLAIGSQPGEFYRVCASLEAATEENTRLRNAFAECNDEICQTLGKALGYPWYKDDQANFPGATERDGVCVGEHVAESLAAEASRRIEELTAERDRLRELNAAWLVGKSCGPTERVADSKRRKDTP